MSYYHKLLDEQGIHAKGVKEAVVLVMGEPTDARLRALGALIAGLWVEFELDCEMAMQLEDLLAIIQVERDWPHSYPPA